MITFQNHKEGFALLLTLIVVSVIISLGLSLVEITIRQLDLSGISRDSEIAFYAAHVGSECAEYSVRSQVGRSEYYTESRPIGLQANGTCDTGGTGSHSYTLLDPNIHQNSYDISWDPGGSARCTSVDVYVMDAVNEGADLTYDFGADLGYKNKSCSSGRVCTLVFSRGYNRACSDIGTLRTLQREVVVEF